MFFETTIMEKTADLAMIQKTNIDTLRKEGKSQRVITERCGCLQSAVSKHIKVYLFQIKVHFAFHLKSCPRVWRRVERHRIHVAWSPVWSFHSQWWFGLPCHLLVLVTVFSEVHSQRSHLPGNFRALHASFCWQALWRCWFHFPAGLGTCPHCQRYQKLVQWPWCYCAWLASKLAWPEPHRESMGYCQEEDERHQTQQCRWPEGHCQRNLGFHTTSAVPQTDHLHATPNWGSN